MTYAPDTRPFYDADSHIMELPNFLTSYADQEFADRIPEVSYSASLVTDEEVAVLMSQGGSHSAEHVDAQVALGDRLIAESKEIQALGAFDAADRSVAMDMLGFKRQLVFATHSVRLPFSASSKTDPELRYAATRAHNRHMAAFCADDDRLMGVAIIPLDDPDRAKAELETVLGEGHQAVWIPHRAPLGTDLHVPREERSQGAGISPGHVDLDDFWARLAETGTPFVLHVGGSPLQSLKAWSNTGRAAVKDWMGGGENVRTKDATVMHQAPETFVTMLVMDGVFDRNPDLRGAAVELGAGWVPEMLRRLDDLCRIYGKADTSVRFDRTPSEQLTQQMGFTPFPHEDVGRLIADSNDELYLFSSDYPHVEGGRDPIGKFAGYLEGASEETLSRFHAENFLRLWPDARVS